MLDPGIQILQWLIRITGKRYRPGAPVAAVRAGYRQLNARFGMRPVSGVETTALKIPIGSVSLAAHLHVPDRPMCTPIPVVLFFHGGGWVIGDVPSYDPLTRYFAHEGRIAVLSVEYRLGPEHPVPTPFDDGIAAYAWLVEHAASLGLDRSRIAVCGDSAGGAIAAAISTFAPQKSLPVPAYQFLMYPPVDGTLRFPSRNAFRKGDMISPEMRMFFLENAVRDKADLSLPYMRLIDAPDIAHLPPTYFLAAGYDSLVDEGRAYAERLRTAGVPVTYQLEATLPHGFANLARVSGRARRALRAGILATSRALTS